MSTYRTLEVSPAAPAKPRREFHYRWQWHLKSSPEALWPLVANTDRFNRDTHVPRIKMTGGEPVINARRKLKMHRISLFGIKLVPIVWYEDPFEWIRPHRFGVVRNYVKGPVRQMRVQVDLNEREDGGTDAVYQVWISPANILGYAAIPFQVGLLSGYDFRRVFHHYDRLAQQNRSLETELGKSRLADGARERLKRARTSLIAGNVDSALIEKLYALLERGDDLTLMRMRPYALADAWGVSRRDVLEMCLKATRAGLLDLRWELLCPQCRGAKEIDEHLNQINPTVHCEVCNIDFHVNFEHSVELTFRPNDSIRQIEEQIYCVGGPQITPHIAAQALVEPGQTIEVTPRLSKGRYRARALSLAGAEPLIVTEDGVGQFTVSAGETWNQKERAIGLTPKIIFENKTPDEQLMLLERLAWSDQAATAAEVTALQVFRDLFASEALRHNIQLSVGSLTLLFTDLRGSTRLYQQYGDAPAFGIVLEHFEVLRSSVAAHDGAIVKTLGDAVMAVFRSPVNAVKAGLQMQEMLSHPPEGTPPLILKVGVNSGTTIAVNLNDRLDYFGTTVNLAARLADLSDGSNVVVSDAVQSDPEVIRWLELHDVTRYSEPFIVQVRGFDEELMRLYRIGLTHLQMEQS